MKIKKQPLLEQVLIEEDEKTLDNVNPSTDSVGDIADAIQATAEEQSNGELSVSDASAKSAASEVKAAAEETGSSFTALNALNGSPKEVIGSQNAITAVLDKALRVAQKGKRQHTAKNPNVMIIGLPGSGKTSIVYDWAHSNGVNVTAINAADPELETAIYGFTIRDVTNPEKNAVTKSYSNFLDGLDKPNSVLFLDELNRAKPHLRRAMMSLINEHTTPDSREPDGNRYFPNLLFTVACINPGGLRADKTADVLSSAETSRFTSRVKFDSNTEASRDYFEKHWDALISKLDPQDPDYTSDLEEYLRNQDIGLFIVSHPEFQYDTPDDVDDIYDSRGDLNMLNQRSLTDGLNLCEGDVEALRDWVLTQSSWLPRDVDMVIKILNSYVVPSLAELIERKEQNTGIRLTSGAAQVTDSAPVEEPETPEEEEEDDADFYAVDSANSTATIMTQEQVGQALLNSITALGNVLDGDNN